MVATARIKIDAQTLYEIIVICVTSWRWLPYGDYPQSALVDAKLHEKHLEMWKDLRVKYGKLSFSRPVVASVFKMIVDAARIDRDEAYQALNMGIGMVLFVESDDLEAVEAHLAAAGEASVRIGTTVEAAGGAGVVRWA